MTVTDVVVIKYITYLYLSIYLCFLALLFEFKSGIY
jgi:hypothetical protein